MVAPNDLCVPSTPRPSSEGCPTTTCSGIYTLQILGPMHTATDASPHVASTAVWLPKPAATGHGSMPVLPKLPLPLTTCSVSTSEFAVHCVTTLVLHVQNHALSLARDSQRAGRDKGVVSPNVAGLEWWHSPRSSLAPVCCWPTQLAVLNVGAWRPGGCHLCKSSLVCASRLGSAFLQCSAGCQARQRPGINCLITGNLCN